MIDDVRGFLDLNDTTRRVLVAAAFLGVLVCGTVLKRIVARLYPRILRLEFAARKEEVDLVMRSWGLEGRKRAALALAIDYLFAVSLGLFLGIVAWGPSTHLFFDDGWGHQLAQGRLLCLLLATLMTTFDIAENSGALLMIAGVRRFVPRLTALCSGAKFVTGSLAVVFPMLVVMRLELDVLEHWWERIWPAIDATKAWLQTTSTALGNSALGVLDQLVR